MRKCFLVFCLASGIALTISFAVAKSARKPVATASAHLPPAAIAALQKIDPEHIRAHVRFLSHDLLEGRGTGQRGGDIAGEYIATQLWLYGLKAAGDNGTFFQKVPMVGITPAPETTFEFSPNKGDSVRLKPLADYVAYDQTQRASDDIDSDISSRVALSPTTAAGPINTKKLLVRALWARSSFTKRKWRAIRGRLCATRIPARKRF